LSLNNLFRWQINLVYPPAFIRALAKLPISSLLCKVPRTQPLL